MVREDEGRRSVGTLGRCNYTLAGIVLRKQKTARKGRKVAPFVKISLGWL